MSSTVYFVPFYLHQNQKGLLERIKSACLEAGAERKISSGDICAIKTHFGEDGLVSYLRPPYARTCVELVKSFGAKPFVTDTNTLYRVQRHNAIDHLATAQRNGFSYGTLGAPVIVADGLHGHAYQEATVPNGKHFESVPLPDAIHDADSMIVLSHFTAHLAAGFGAAVKNLSMGCSTPQGKRRMHCHSKPTVDEDRCIACGTCEPWCPTGAIKVEDVAEIDSELCMACGECTVVCPEQAVQIPWDENTSILQEKMAEYASAVVAQKKDRLLLINALVDITPHCDCMAHSEPCFRPDLGVLVGDDPIALDQAGLDLINGKSLGTVTKS